MPWFSIVIPACNRQHELPRALASCLTQSFVDFELIVVDDGSTDDTAAVVESCGDARALLIRHATNRGQGAARNTGISAATGVWIVSFDSDDELLPGALAVIHEKILAAGSAVERLAFMLERDDGRVSPLPALRDEILDYPAYLAWLEGRELYDFLPCTKRVTFETVRWEERRWTDHALYYLDFAARYRTLFCSDRVAFVHTGARNRISGQRRAPRNAVQAAVPSGAEMDLLLERHGEALRQFAPHTWQMYQRMRVSCHFLAGERRKGLAKLRQCLLATPFSADVWLMLLFGLAGPKIFARVRSWRGPAT